MYSCSIPKYIILIPCQSIVSNLFSKFSIRSHQDLSVGTVHLITFEIQLVQTHLFYFWSSSPMGYRSQVSDTCVFMMHVSDEKGHTTSSYLFCFFRFPLHIPFSFPPGCFLFFQYRCFFLIFMCNSNKIK